MKSILIIIPAHNEEKNIVPLYEKLGAALKMLEGRFEFKMLYVNDGSVDNTIGEIEKLAQKDARVKYIDFSRNFGKEIATTAGINACTQDACILLDADLQHPIEKIPEFVEKWEQGFEVVIGVRKESKSDSFLKKTGSFLFYKIMTGISEVDIIPGATDFRLIDKIVVQEFNRFSETNRMTRALIDWLGFKRTYVYFEANERLHGTASYSLWKLFKLAINGLISLSLVPLKIAGYLGIFISVTSGVLGFYNLLGKYIFYNKKHPLFDFSRTFSDSENLAILIVFLVGILLVSIGLLAIYVASIHSEVIRRPLYVVRQKNI